MDKVIICRCEEVTLEEITNAVRAYNCSAREIKLRTRAAMGYCGGRTCRHAVEAILRNRTDDEQQDIPLKIQPPVRPVSLALLGSQVNDDE